MKKLYARLVLRLIRPALELQEKRDAAAMTKEIEAMDLVKPFRDWLAVKSR